MKHKHHIVPRHRGGTDDPSNLVEVTPIQHAMFHYCEWKLWGKVQDFCAYKMILGDVNNPEFRKAASMRGIYEIKRKLNEDNDFKKKYSENGKKNGKLGNKAQREKFEKEGRTIAEQRWIVTTPEGETLQISNLKKFCRENNLLPNKMCEVAKGMWKQHRGYSCKKENL